ncbi:hypothetical protein DMN91_001878 [Ooceraea biroi]|uniref:Uncharacterized protein n=1 Tax=Ooceraea biroi TaxID=2015173 RepID=A0A3L8DZ35_OOCBI|nr:hypothetical protein DMN91_001878 [Ooceraea biroi]
MQNEESQRRTSPYIYPNRLDENIVNLYFDQVPPGNYTLLIPYKKFIHYDREEEGYLKLLFEPDAYHRMRHGPMRNGQHRLLATNIQSIEARKWFPCWDEPELKATFQIRFKHEKKYKIWPSFSAESIVQDKQNWIWTNFNITYPISTYHVMFTLTDLELVQISTHTYVYKYEDRYEVENEHKYTSRPTSTEQYKISMFKIWSRLSAKFTNFSEIVADKILKSEWYKKLPIRSTSREIYSTSSTDLIAIPAMKEDVIGKWMLILYKESLVTYDEEIDSSAHKREVASTLARGMVYQAIDNAITLSEWSHLWFKKGLAPLLHVELLDEIFPKWRFLDLFVVQVQQDCLRLDTDFTMKPLSYEVRTPSEIKSLFSFPIYIKAPVILRMIQHSMGNEFQEMIKKQTDTYKFESPPSPKNFWNMQVNIVNDNREIDNSTMKDIMETWITSNNHPIVYVHRREYLLSISVYYIDDEGALCGPTSHTVNNKNIRTPQYF